MLKFPYGRLELPSAVFIILKEIEACAGRGKQYCISGLCILIGKFYGLLCTSGIYQIFDLVLKTVMQFPVVYAKAYKCMHLIFYQSV